MTTPDIEIDEIDPVIVGKADGIVVLGVAEGTIVGITAGAAVMNISQQRKFFNSINFHQHPKNFRKIFIKIPSDEESVSPIS